MNVSGVIIKLITARHTEYDEGYVLSLSVNREGGGGPCSSEFCHQMSY